MSYQQAYEFDYMADEGEMAHFLDEMDEENHAGDAVMDEYEMVCYLYFLLWFVSLYACTQYSQNSHDVGLNMNSLLKWLILRLPKRERVKTFKVFLGTD